MSVNSFLLAQSSVNSLSVGPAVLRAVLPDFRVVFVIGALAAQTFQPLVVGFNSLGRPVVFWLDAATPIVCQPMGGGGEG